MKTAEPRALHNTADTDECEEQRHEREVAHLNCALLVLRVLAVVVVPPLPIFPGCVLSGVGGPALPVEVPVVWIILGGCAVMPCPSGAPRIVGFALVRVGEDVVCCDEHAVPLQAGLEGDVEHGGSRMAAVWVVEFDEGVVAGFLVGVAFFAVQDLVWGGCCVGVDGWGPCEEVGIAIAVGVCCVGASVECVLGL